LILGNSNAGDLTASFEESPKAVFSSLIAQVTDEDTGGGRVSFSLGEFSGSTEATSATSGGSLVSGDGLFDGDLSATEISAAIANSGLKAIFSGESDEGNTLGSTIGSLEEVDTIEGTAFLEVFSQIVFTGSERKSLNDDFVGVVQSLTTFFTLSLSSLDGLSSNGLNLRSSFFFFFLFFGFFNNLLGGGSLLGLGLGGGFFTFVIAFFNDLLGSGFSGGSLLGGLNFFFRAFFRDAVINLGGGLGGSLSSGLGSSLLRGRFFFRTFVITFDDLLGSGLSSRLSSNLLGGSNGFFFFVAGFFNLLLGLSFSSGLGSRLLGGFVFRAGFAGVVVLDGLLGSNLLGDLASLGRLDDFFFIRRFGFNLSGLLGSSLSNTGVILLLLLDDLKLVREG